MPEPKTLPQTFTLKARRGPSEAHAAWLARTERLVNGFEAQLSAVTTASTQPAPSIGFVLMLCDFLWDERGEEADFAALDVANLVEHCEAILRADVMVRGFANTLSGFYEFLAAQYELDGQAAREITEQLRAVPEILAELRP